MAKLLIMLRYDHLPMLPSGSGGVQLELVVYVFAGTKIRRKRNSKINNFWFFLYYLLVLLNFEMPTSSSAIAPNAR